ncbi:hypothetical protein [Rhodobacter capsulatus]|uniref:hypothetical protein n=1 Tax=Rhodobacter capsulatus TaxID=1061 RepID=UPI0040289EF2
MALTNQEKRRRQAEEAERRERAENRPGPLGTRRQIPRSEVGQSIGVRLSAPVIFSYSEDIGAVVGPFAANTQTAIQIPCGEYTYRQFFFRLVASAAIAGETDPVDGEYIVRSAFFEKYVDQISLEIGGREAWRFTGAEFYSFARYLHGGTINEGFLAWGFGAPRQFKENMAEDAYLFGTQGISSARIMVRASAQWPAGMVLKPAFEYAPITRPIGFFVTTTRNVYNVTAPGKQLFTDIPFGIDFSRIWVLGPGVKAANLEIDGVEAFNAQASSIRALSRMWGQRTDMLPDGLMLDFWRDQDGKGVDSLARTVSQRARAADVRLTLDLDTGGTAKRYDIITFHCGPYESQR